MLNVKPLGIQVARFLLTVLNTIPICLVNDFLTFTLYPPYKLTTFIPCRRIIFLETVAGVPGMVAAMTRHLHSLRRMQRDYGWIHTLLGKFKVTSQLATVFLLAKRTLHSSKKLFLIEWKYQKICPHQKKIIRITVFETVASLARIRHLTDLQWNKTNLHLLWATFNKKCRSLLLNCIFLIY